MRELFILCLLFTRLSLVIAEDMFFQQYGINEGLSSNVVFGIAEDNRGLLWIATTEGVDKFDGLNFKHYSLPQLLLNGVLDYNEFYIQSDSQGKIWLATKTGLIYRYNILEDEFELVHQFRQEANIPSLVGLRAFFIDRNDRVLIAMNDGVWQLNSSSYQVQRVSENNQVLFISQDEEQRYYWSDNVGISVLDSSLQEIQRLYPSGEDGTSGHRISRLYIDDHTQTLWGVSDSEGVFFINLVNYECTFPGSLSRYKGLATRTISRFSNHEIIIGVDGLGLVIWDKLTRSVTKEITYQDGKMGTLSSNAIYSIYQNRDGIFFVSTHRGGINVYNPNKLNFGYMNSILNNHNSLKSNYTLYLKEISPGVIAFCTYEGISIWDKDKDQWLHLTDEDKKVSEVILSMDVDENQDIWATSFTRSLMYFKKRAGTYESNKNFHEQVKLRSQSIYIDKQKRIWLSSHTGIYMYSIDKETLAHFPLNGVLTLMDLPGDMLVLGTDRGLSFFDMQNFKFHNYDFIDEAGLDMRLVKCLRRDSRNRLWAGTKTDGLFVVDFYNRTIRNITVEDGLPVNHIFGIATGENDTWVSTLKGISKIDKDFNITSYSTSDGLASIDFNYDAALCDRDGMLYFGTNDGVITLIPRDLDADLPHKNIVFSDFRIDHKRVLPGKDSPLQRETNFVDEIILGYDQNSFSMGFECVDFIQPEAGVFSWKLENFDDHWLESDQLPIINYTNLNPGDYTFHLRVNNERGELISNEKSIDILIGRPIWFTLGAFAIYGLILLIIFWAVFYFYRLKMLSRNSSERLGFLINLAHDIKTPLLLIKAPLNDLMSNENITGVVRKNVSIALSSAERLHRQMIQFMDMGNLSRIENTLSLEHTDLVRFLRDKITAFRVLAEKKGLSLEFQQPEAKICIKTDRELLDKIISNLLSNSIKYTNEGGKVRVVLQMTDTVCSILVTDSGIGIIKSEQKNIFKPFYRTDRARQSGATGNGMGLVLASNLAKMLKGKLSLIESSEKGTTFELKFPYKVSEQDDRCEAISDKQAEQDDHRTRILLVEDDEELLNYSIGKLSEHYQVISATNGIEAMEKTRQKLPSVIISDVLMPQMSGLQLCMKLKDDIRTSHIPIILFTGLDSKEEILEGLEAGADDYIVKPFEFDILVKKVDTLLNNRKILQKKFLYQTSEDEELGFASRLDDRWISEVNSFVEEHMEEPDLSPSDLYRQFGMSRSAFYHKTKSLMDLSPLELIRTIRLKKAKLLLGTSDNDISEVSYKVGFNDPKYFSTVFKKSFGQTPSSFIASKKSLKDDI